MELVLVKTFKEDTVEASLTIEKELLYSSFNSNYESKNLYTNICKEDVISNVEYGLGLINNVNNTIYSEGFPIMFAKPEKIILDSTSVNGLKDIFCKLAEDNSKKRICLSNIEVIVADNLV